MNWRERLEKIQDLRTYTEARARGETGDPDSVDWSTCADLLNGYCGTGNMRPMSERPLYQRIEAEM